MAPRVLRICIVSWLSVGIMAVSVAHAAPRLCRCHVQSHHHRLQCCQQPGCPRSKPAICQGVAPLIIGSYDPFGTNTEWDRWWLKFRSDVCRDLPFRAGTTVAEVRRLADENQKQIDAIRGNQDVRAAGGTVDRGTFIANLYEVYDAHFLYMNFDESKLHNGTGSVSLIVNGMQQFYVDMAIENGRVKNIYLVPGNWNAIMPLAVLFDGSGQPVGVASAIYGTRRNPATAK